MPFTLMDSSDISGKGGGSNDGDSDAEVGVNTEVK